MKLLRFLFNLIITITAIQSAAQPTLNKQRNFAQKFAFSDDTDVFAKITLTLSELLGTCKSPEIERFGLIRDHFRHTCFSQTFLNAFTMVQIKYLVLGENELFIPLRRCIGLYRSKLDAFIVIASTARNLEYMLKRLRNTKWHNSEGLFILLDSFTVKSGCRNAESYLRYTWKLNILDAVFFCLDFNKEILIYAYNPFTNKAPQPWQEVLTFGNDTRSPNWTLFKRNFIRNKTMCADLVFDKTSQLDGYEYKGIAVHLPPALSVNKTAQRGMRYTGIDSKIHLSFLKHVNANTSLTVKTDGTIGWIEPNGVAHDLLGNVSREEYDILVNYVYNFNKYQATMTYPHLYSGLAILTKSAGLQTGQVKIFHFMNPKLMGFIAIVYIVTIFVLGILNRYGITTAFLEVTRLVTNCSMTRRIERTPLRIYLFPVFLLFLISNAAFQCNLAAILTRPIGNPNIDTLEDLLAADLQTYAGFYYKDIVNDTMLSNLRFIGHWNCSHYVINNENTACLADRYELMKVVVDGAHHNLYLSSQNILTLTSAYVVKPFWPLKRKFDDIISRLFTSGILDLWKRQDAQIFTQSYQVYRTVLNDRSFRILTIEDLKFAFFSLIIGLGCSVLVFFVECIISYYGKGRRRRNVSLTFVE